MSRDPIRLEDSSSSFTVCIASDSCSPKLEQRDDSSSMSVSEFSASPFGSASSMANMVVLFSSFRLTAFSFSRSSSAVAATIHLRFNSTMRFSAVARSIVANVSCTNSSARVSRDNSLFWYCARESASSLWAKYVSNRPLLLGGVELASSNGEGSNASPSMPDSPIGDSPSCITLL